MRVIFLNQYDQDMNRDDSDGVYSEDRIETALKQLNTIQVCVDSSLAHLGIGLGNLI